MRSVAGTGANRETAKMSAFFTDGRRRNGESRLAVSQVKSRHESEVRTYEARYVKSVVWDID